MRCTHVIMVVALGLTSLLPATQPAQDETTVARPAPPDRAELEREFEAMLTGAKLIGHFTLDGAAKDKPLREEQYSIVSVKKIRGNVWRFDCRIQYEENDVTVPIPLAVTWAGDTPVIGLTDMKIPGLGTYTARVLFYRDKYAGTWSAGDHGGHLFGRIERPAPAADENDEDDS